MAIKGEKLRQRGPQASSPSSPARGSTTAIDIPLIPLLRKAPASASTQEQVDGDIDEVEDKMNMVNLSRKSQWIILAIASGACAAFNGVFAKLTTTELTTSFATAIARFLSLGDGEKTVEVVIRVMFFGLNLIFNGVMWTLFTKALARGTSTTQVSIINTSSNFMITAILSFLIFAESLPPLWWLGAALLVAGNVIIGRREEKDVDPDAEAHVAAEDGQGTFSEGTFGERGSLLDDNIELIDETEIALKKQTEEEQDDDILDLENLETGNGMRNDNR